MLQNFNSLKQLAVYISVGGSQSQSQFSVCSFLSSTWQIANIHVYVLIYSLTDKLFPFLASFSSPPQITDRLSPINQWDFFVAYPLYHYRQFIYTAQSCWTNKKEIMLEKKKNGFYLCSVTSFFIAVC